jgi:hypothetical protein
MEFLMNDRFDEVCRQYGCGPVQFSGADCVFTSPAQALNVLDFEPAATKPLDARRLVLAADGKLVMIPVESIKYLQFFPTPEKSPAYAIKGVKFKH